MSNLFSPMSCVVAQLVAPFARAKNWADGTGNWSVASNWSPAAVPVAGEAVNIVNVDTTSRTVTLDVSTPSSLGLVSIDQSGNLTAVNTLSITSTSNFTLTSAALFVGGYSGSAATIGQGATINTSAMNLNGVPAKLNWTSGKLNIMNNVTWNSGGGVTSTAAIFGSARTLGANQTLMITGNETLVARERGPLVSHSTAEALTM